MVTVKHGRRDVFIKGGCLDTPFQRSSKITFDPQNFIEGVAYLPLKIALKNLHFSRFSHSFCVHVPPPRFQKFMTPLGVC